MPLRRKLGAQRKIRLTLPSYLELYSSLTKIQVS